MTLLRLFKRGEARVVVVGLAILLLMAALAGLLVAWELLPAPQGSVGGTRLDLRGAPAAARGWPSATPHTSPWPPPSSWYREHTPGVWYFNVRGDNPTSISGNGYSMSLYQSGWPLPVLERKAMWWDWDDTALEGPVQDPAPQILYGRLALNTLILGGGLWLLVFGPLGAWVIGRRVSWMLRGHCSFCGYDMVGVERCPECGWCKDQPR